MDFLQWACGMTGTLSILAVPPASMAMIRSPVHDAEFRVELVAAAIETFEKDCGHLPSSEEFPQLLLSSGESCWHGPYLLDKDLPDPWGRPMHYEVIEGYRHGHKIYSLGADGVGGSADDIVYGDAAESWRINYPSPRREDSLAGEYLLGASAGLFATTAILWLMSRYRRATRTSVN